MLKYDPEYQNLVQNTLKNFQESLTIPTSDVILEQDEDRESLSPNSPNPRQKRLKTVDLNLGDQMSKVPE